MGSISTVTELYSLFPVKFAFDFSKHRIGKRVERQVKPELVNRS